MGLIECTSGASLWRGYDYYKEKKVKHLQKVSDTQYAAEVVGTSSAPYKVLIDIAHPRTSKCNCPHADGKHIVCKHMVKGVLRFRIWNIVTDHTLINPLFVVYY